jgi:pilus assembly protein Flp/PilA
MANLLQRLVREESGQDLTEYGLLLGIITVAALVGIQEIGPKVGSYFSNLNATLP